MSDETPPVDPPTLWQDLTQSTPESRRHPEKFIAIIFSAMTLAFLFMVMFVEPTWQKFNQDSAPTFLVTFLKIGGLASLAVFLGALWGIVTVQRAKNVTETPSDKPPGGA